MVGRFLEGLRKRAFNMKKSNRSAGNKRHGQAASEGRKLVTMLNEKGVVEGGVIPNSYSDVGSP